MRGRGQKKKEPGTEKVLVGTRLECIRTFIRLDDVFGDGPCLAISGTGVMRAKHKPQRVVSSRCPLRGVSMVTKCHRPFSFNLAQLVPEWLPPLSRSQLSFSSILLACGCV